jgi:hypothetical protein
MTLIWPSQRAKAIDTNQHFIRIGRLPWEQTVEKQVAAVAVTNIIKLNEYEILQGVKLYCFNVLFSND